MGLAEFASKKKKKLGFLTSDIGGAGAGRILYSFDVQIGAGSNLGSFLVTIRPHTFWRLVSIQSYLDWITNFLNVDKPDLSCLEASFRSPLLNNGLSEKDVLLGTNRTLHVSKRVCCRMSLLTL